LTSARDLHARSISDIDRYVEDTRTTGNRVTSATIRHHESLHEIPEDEA